MTPTKITLLHLSDLHVTGAGVLFGTISVADHLRELAGRLRAIGLAVDAVVVTGDLVHRRDVEAYDTVRPALDALSTSLGAALVVLPGNHDDPHHPMFDAPRAHQVGPLRLVTLDSSAGELGPQQLSDLREMLRQPADWGTVLCLHHSPLPSPLAPLAGRRLGDPAALAEVLSGTDVRLLLTGHYHHVHTGGFAGAGVWSTPALAYQHRTDRPDRVPGTVLNRPMYSVLTLDRDTWSAAPFDLREPSTDLACLT